MDDKIVHLQRIYSNLFDLFLVNGFLFSLSKNLSAKFDGEIFISFGFIHLLYSCCYKLKAKSSGEISTSLAYWSNPVLITFEENDY